jgi:hypothetical protein
MRRTRIAVLAVAGISATAAVPMAHAVQPAHPQKHKPRVINVTFTNSLGVSPLQVAARAERTLSHGKVAYGPNLSVYIARTKNYFAHALIIDCGDPPSLMQGMTSALAIEGTRIVALTCSTPPVKVRPGLPMPSPRAYVPLKRHAFYGVWRDIDRAALHYHVQKHDLKSVSANGGRVTLLYKCRHLHDLLYARLDTNPVFGVPEVVTRSCAAQGHEHVHRAMF